MLGNESCSVQKCLTEQQSYCGVTISQVIVSAQEKKRRFYYLLLLPLKLLVLGSTLKGGLLLVSDTSGLISLVLTVMTFSTC